MIEWTLAADGTPEKQIFDVIRRGVAITGAKSFPAECAAFLIASAGDTLTEVQRVAIGTAAERMLVENPLDLQATLNAILFGTWDTLGVKNMPEGAALTHEQRLGFIQGIYAFSAQKIAAVCADLQTLIAVDYQHPTIPVVGEATEPEQQ